MVKNIVLKKATANFRGRDYIAWYNDKLPYPDGPYKFYGLPGLIFKIYDTKKHFYYELTSYKIFNSTKKLEIDYDSNSKTTTKKEFRLTANAYNTNPIALMESEGAVFSEETKRVIKQRFEQRQKQVNNPIELTNE